MKFWLNEHPDLEEQRQMSKPRWHVIIRYHTDSGFRDIQREIEELEDLQEIVEAGPNWYAIKGIVITHIRRVAETRTVEQAAAE